MRDLLLLAAAVLTGWACILAAIASLMLFPPVLGIVSAVLCFTMVALLGLGLCRYSQRRRQS